MSSRIAIAQSCAEFWKRPPSTIPSARRWSKRSAISMPPAWTRRTIDKLGIQPLAPGTRPDRRDSARKTSSWMSWSGCTRWAWVLSFDFSSEPGREKFHTNDRRRRSGRPRPSGSRLLFENTIPSRSSCAKNTWRTCKRCWSWRANQRRGPPRMRKPCCALKPIWRKDRSTAWRAATRIRLITKCRFRSWRHWLRRSTGRNTSPALGTPAFTSLNVSVPDFFKAAEHGSQRHQPGRSENLSSLAPAARRSDAAGAALPG